jgi:hypothetical protein
VCWTVVVIAIVIGLFEIASAIDPISGGDAGPEAFFAAGVAIWLFGLSVFLAFSLRARVWDPGLRAGAAEARRSPAQSQREDERKAP